MRRQLPGWTAVLARRQQARRLPEPPPLHYDPTMTDDDVDFHNDIIFLRCLPWDIAGECKDQKRGPKPRSRVEALVDDLWRMDLILMLDELRHDEQWQIPSPQELQDAA